MTSTSTLVPPAPPVRTHDLPAWRVLMLMTRNVLEVWSDRSFEELVIRSKNFGGRAVLINDPEGARHVLSGGDRYRRPVSARRLARPVVGDGLLLAEGADWKRQRRMLAPVFSPAGVEPLIPHFQAAAAALMDRLQGASTANLSAQMHQTTLDATLRALFSHAADQGERLAFGRMIRRYGRGPGRPTPLDAFARSEADHAWLLGGRRRFVAERAAALQALVQARRSAGGDGNGEDDMLGLLLAARDPQTGEGLSDAEVGDQAATMLFAGFETTSRLLFWCAYLLALDPSEQDRLREEVRAFPPEQVATLDDLRHWPRLRLVLLETLRLYPPAPNIVREAVAADEVAGETIRPGDQVWVSPWVMHRHRKLWQDPLAFSPSRFEGQAAPWTGGPFMPFGGGPRTCIGASFAIAEAQILMATVLHRFRFDVVGQTPVLPRALLTIFPGREPVFNLKPAS